MGDKEVRPVDLEGDQSETPRPKCGADAGTCTEQEARSHGKRAGRLQAGAESWAAGAACSEQAVGPKERMGTEENAVVKERRKRCACGISIIHNSLKDTKWLFQFRVFTVLCTAPS